jgi:Short C-terminal domain
MLLRRRPVGMVARTAVVAGTATAVSNRVSRRQANRGDAQQPQETQETQAQTAAAPEAPSDVEQLQQLATLHEQGILTDEEYSAKKQQILGI